MTKLEWDYTERAATYDLRVDYSQQGIVDLVRKLGLSAGTPVADVGAGTGKLSRPLAALGLDVRAVEPNDAMRSFGVSNTTGMTVTWRKGTAEETGLEPSSVRAAFFGSSFNVVDQGRALGEVERILVPGGHFVCLWNHRDLQDPLQSRIESAIRQRIPGYTYGKRREDPSAVIVESGRFDAVSCMEDRFLAQVPSADFLEAWKSHATLARQAGDHFAEVLAAIASELAGRSSITVPYTTRIWFARSKAS